MESYSPLFAEPPFEIAESKRLPSIGYISMLVMLDSTNLWWARQQPYEECLHIYEYHDASGLSGECCKSEMMV
jgi:hypothetical protein